MTLLLEREAVRGYFPDLAKSLFICDSPAQEEAPKQAFQVEVLGFNMVPGRKYFGAYVGSEEDRGAWVYQQVKKWAEGVRVLPNTANRNPQTA